MSLDLNRKMLIKTQTAYSFRYCKHCEHLKIIGIQNLKQQFLEIHFIMNIEVMMAQAHIFIYYMEESVLLGTKPLVDSIRHSIRDPSGVFPVCHAFECHIVQ